MPNKGANVKNEKKYEAPKDKGMSKERAARINSPGASSRGGKKPARAVAQAGRHGAEEGRGTCGQAAAKKGSCSRM